MMTDSVCAREKVLCLVPDCIHAFILSDELNKLLDSQTELEATLSEKQTKEISHVQPDNLHVFTASILLFMNLQNRKVTSKITLAVLRLFLLIYYHLLSKWFQETHISLQWLWPFQQKIIIVDWVDHHVLAGLNLNLLCQR